MNSLRKGFVIGGLALTLLTSACGGLGNNPLQIGLDYEGRKASVGNTALYELHVILDSKCGIRLPRDKHLLETEVPSGTPYRLVSSVSKGDNPVYLQYRAVAPLNGGSPGIDDFSVKISEYRVAMKEEAPIVFGASSRNPPRGMSDIADRVLAACDR